MILTPTSSIYFRIFTIPILLALASCYQLIFFGYPYGHDWIFELVRLEEYFFAIQSGQIPPYWGNNLYGGFGSPIFIYYAPLYNIIASVFLSFGTPLTISASLTLVLFMIIAAIGMTGLIWEINNRSTEAHILTASNIAAIAYIFAPYLIANMLVRNADAEFTAMCIAPYPFWGLAMLHNNRRSGFILLSLGITFSILAHNLTALVITTTSLVSVFAYFINNKKPVLFLKSIAFIIYGIGMAAWFWLPALWLKDQVRIEEMLLGKFNYQNNFSSITDLFGYEYFYSAGFLSLIILLISSIMLIKLKRNLLIASLIIAACLFLFLQLSNSAFIWANVPFMPLFQFTWRLMGPFTFTIAILTGIILCQYKLKTKHIELLIILIIILNATPLFKLYQPLPSEIYNVIPNYITEDGVRINNLPATVLDEYLPKQADKSLLQKISSKNKFLLSELSDIKIITNNKYIQINSSSPEISHLEIARWFFPIWRAKTTKEDKLYLKKDAGGTLLLEIPHGDQTIILKSYQPTIRKVGFIISIFFIAVLCITLLYYKKGKTIG